MALLSIGVLTANESSPVSSNSTNSNSKITVSLNTGAISITIVDNVLMINEDIPGSAQSFIIYNTYGVQVKSGSGLSVDIHGLESGSYLLQVHTNDGIVSFGFTKPQICCDIPEPPSDPVE